MSRLSPTVKQLLFRAQSTQTAVPVHVNDNNRNDCNFPALMEELLFDDESSFVTNLNFLDRISYVANDANHHEDLAPLRNTSTGAAELAALILGGEGKGAHTITPNFHPLITSDEISHASCVENYLSALRTVVLIEVNLRSLLPREHQPHLFRDVIASEHILVAFQEQEALASKSTSAILLQNLLWLSIGPPDSLNLRNLLWHGFFHPCEFPFQFTHWLRTLLHLILKTFGKEDVGIDELPIHSELNEHIPLSFYQYGVEELKPQGRYNALAGLLFTQAEHKLRKIFCGVNGCSKRVQTAESSSLFTTFTEMFSSTYVTNEGETQRNMLWKCLGRGFLEFSFDLLILPQGQRIRDKLSHGEFEMDTSIIKDAMDDIEFFYTFILAKELRKVGEKTDAQAISVPHRQIASYTSKYLEAYECQRTIQKVKQACEELQSLVVACDNVDDVHVKELLSTWGIEKDEEDGEGVDEECILSKNQHDDNDNNDNDEDLIKQLQALHPSCSSSQSKCDLLFLKPMLEELGMLKDVLLIQGVVDRFNETPFLQARPLCILGAEDGALELCKLLNKCADMLLSSILALNRKVLSRLGMEARDELSRRGYVAQGKMMRLLPTACFWYTLMYHAIYDMLSPRNQLDGPHLPSCFQEHGCWYDDIDDKNATISNNSVTTPPFKSPTKKHAKAMRSVLKGLQNIRQKYEGMHWDDCVSIWKHTASSISSQLSS